MSAKDATGAAIKADTLYESLCGMSVEGLGEFAAGTNLRGSHPALAVAGVLFAPVGLDDRERAKLTAGQWAARQPPTEPPRRTGPPPRPHVAPRDAVIALRDVEAPPDLLANLTGSGIAFASKGARVHKREPLVKRLPEASRL